MRVFCGLLCAVPVGLLVEVQWGECKRVVCVRGGGGGLWGDIFRLKYPFCDINRVGCPRLTHPGCRIGGITAGSDFCFCSHLTEVPTSPDVSINLSTKE